MPAIMAMDSSTAQAMINRTAPGDRIFVALGRSATGVACTVANADIHRLPVGGWSNQSATQKMNVEGTRLY